MLRQGSICLHQANASNADDGSARVQLALTRVGELPSSAAEGNVS